MKLNPNGDSGQRGTPAYWPLQTPYLYTVGIADVLKARAFKATGTWVSTFDDPEDADGNPPTGSTFGYPGASPVISSNGTDFGSAVVWVLEINGLLAGTGTVLTAYAAKPPAGTPPTTLTQLWTSYGKGLPAAGATTFMVPTVANGKVYVAGQSGSCSKGTCGGTLVIYHQ